MSWKLSNTEARATEHPASFQIPSRAKREALRVGDLAKLIFRDKGVGERMWVKVTGVEAGGYRGQLTNAPAAVHGLAKGDSVKFGPEHIASLDAARGIARHAFSTQRFGVGHLVGASILLFGTVGIARALIERHRAKMQAIGHTRGINLAQNERGQYGVRP